MSDIDITGLDKATVLAALYNGSRPQGLGFLQYSEGDMTQEQAQALLDSGHTYFDYLYGRVMKLDLASDDSFNPWGYDRDNGSGAAKVIIDELRANGIGGIMTSTIHEHGRMHAANQMSEHLGGETTFSKKGRIATMELGIGDDLTGPVRDKISPYLDTE